MPNLTNLSLLVIEDAAKLRRRLSRPAGIDLRTGPPRPIARFFAKGNRRDMQRAKRPFLFREEIPVRLKRLDNGVRNKVRTGQERDF